VLRASSTAAPRVLTTEQLWLRDDNYMLVVSYTSAGDGMGGLYQRTVSVLLSTPSLLAHLLMSRHTSSVAEWETR
jgi:hypothetical protein